MQSQCAQNTYQTFSQCLRHLKNIYITTGTILNFSPVFIIDAIESASWQVSVQQRTCKGQGCSGSILHRGDYPDKLLFAVSSSFLQRACQPSQQHFAMGASPPSCLQLFAMLATAVCNVPGDSVLQNHNVCSATAADQTQLLEQFLQSCKYYAAVDRRTQDSSAPSLISAI